MAASVVCSWRKTQIAHFIQDAHAEYVFGDNEETKSTPKSFEEVFVKAKNAHFWVNVGNHKTKKNYWQLILIMQK